MRLEVLSSLLFVSETTKRPRDLNLPFPSLFICKADGLVTEASRRWIRVSGRLPENTFSPALVGRPQQRHNGEEVIVYSWLGVERCH